jgi:hypothetical protein
VDKDEAAAFRRAPGEAPASKPMLQPDPADTTASPTPEATLVPLTLLVLFALLIPTRLRSRGWNGPLEPCEAETDTSGFTATAGLLLLTPDKASATALMGLTPAKGTPAPPAKSISDPAETGERVALSPTVAIIEIPRYFSLGWDGMNVFRECLTGSQKSMGGGGAGVLFTELLLGVKVMWRDELSGEEAVHPSNVVVVVVTVTGAAGLTEIAVAAVLLPAALAAIAKSSG